MTTILHVAALAGVCLGLCVFVLLAASSHLVWRLDQEVADEAAGAPHPGTSPAQAETSTPAL
jgi:hypothetical protein